MNRLHVLASERNETARSALEYRGSTPPWKTGGICKGDVEPPRF